MAAEQELIVYLIIRKVAMVGKCWWVEGHVLRDCSADILVKT